MARKARFGVPRNIRKRFFLRFHWTNPAIVAVVAIAVVVAAAAAAVAMAVAMAATTVVGRVLLL
jgi:hypothetical protein